MNVRFIATLLVLLLGLQSVAPVGAAAQPPAPASHCGESMQHDAPMQHTIAAEHECPHCSGGDSMDAGDCASYCASAVALIPAAFSISRSQNPAPAARASAGLHSRFDIPPTPPPIA